MRSRLTFSVALPFLLLAGAPALATDYQHNFGATERTSAAFAGFQVRMNIGDRRPARPTARLQLGMAHYAGSAADGHRLERHGSALELGLSRRGRADLYLAGERVTDVQHRMGVAPLAAVALGIGALAVGTVAVVTLVNGRDPKTGCPPGVEVCTQ